MPTISVFRNGPYWSFRVGFSNFEYHTMFGREPEKATMGRVLIQREGNFLKLHPTKTEMGYKIVRSQPTDKRWSPTNFVMFSNPSRLSLMDKVQIKAMEINATFDQTGCLKIPLPDKFVTERWDSSRSLSLNCAESKLQRHKGKSPSPKVPTPTKELTTLSIDSNAVEQLNAAISLVNEMAANIPDISLHINVNGRVRAKLRVPQSLVFNNIDFVTE